MTKYTCLDCKHYCHQEKTFDGIEAKTIEHHCSKYPHVFTKWWDENCMKHRDDITDVPKCLELNDHLASLNKMIHLSEQILAKL